ncbi:hypothetical protein F3J08_07635 [Asaia sp. As-1742]|nr:hypothetical protein [Asaia sp. As-1742]
MEAKVLDSTQESEIYYDKSQSGSSIEGGESLLIMPEDVSAKDITFRIVSNYDVELSIANDSGGQGNDTITLKNQYKYSASGDNFAVASIQLSNGVVWTAISPNNDMTHPGSLFLEKEVVDSGVTKAIYAPTKVAADVVSYGGNAFVEGTGLLNVVGTYNFLSIHNTNNDYNRIFCTITNYGEIQNTGYYAYSNVTLQGANSILNIENAKANVLGDGGSLYTSGYGNIIANGTFKDMIVNSCDINTLNVTLLGNGLIQNSRGWNGFTLTGNASNLTADNSAISVVADEGSITLNNGASCLLKGSSDQGQNVFVNANGKSLSYTADTNTNVTVNVKAGEATEVYGAGYTTNIVDLNGSGKLDVANFTGANGRIVATNMTDLSKLHVTADGSDAVVSYDGSDAVIRLHNTSVSALTVSAPTYDETLRANAVSLILDQSSHGMAAFASTDSSSLVAAHG